MESQLRSQKNEVIRVDFCSNIETSNAILDELEDI